ncbi:MAG: hypothetical protein ACYC5N_01605 [Endomicrobiales bacterium]
MKKVVLCLGVMLSAAALAYAEPLVLEQAGNVLGAGTLEIGAAEVSYQNDAVSITDAAGTELMKMTDTRMGVPLFARYAFTPKAEAAFTLAYVSRSSKSETGGVSSVTDASGPGDPVLGAKVQVADNAFNNGWKVGVGGTIGIPAGDRKLRQGLNLSPLVALSRAFPQYLVNINVSYGILGEFEDAGSVKQDAGDTLNAGVGVEYPLPVKGGSLSGVGELAYQSFGESKAAGVTQKDSAGNRMDLVLGARWQAGSLKTKFGVALALGEEKYRTYDYRIIAGVTFLVGVRPEEGL